MSRIFIKLAGIEARNLLLNTKIMSGEIRCYMKDPDGYLIEVGQAK